MKRIILLIALCGLFLATACSDPGIERVARGISYYHDKEHAVSCWIAYSTSIACLPDRQVRLEAQP